MRSADPDSQPVGQANSEQIVQLCAFRVGSEEYVIDLRRVEQILRLPKVTRVPRAPAHIDGVVNVRGAIVPVIDLRTRLQASAPPADSRPKCIICRVGRERLAILVDAMSEVVRLPRTDLKPSPPLLATAATPYVLGVCGPPGKLKLLLDLKALFGPQRSAAEEEPG